MVEWIVYLEFWFVIEIASQKLQQNYKIYLRILTIKLLLKY